MGRSWGTWGNPLSGTGPAAPDMIATGERQTGERSNHGRRDRPVGRRVARAVDPRAIRRAPAEGDGTGLHRPLLEPPRPRRLPLRRLRERTVRFGKEIRLRIRLAKLHGADAGRAGQGRGRYELRNAPHGGPL